MVPIADLAARTECLSSAGPLLTAPCINLLSCLLAYPATLLRIRVVLGVCSILPLELKRKNFLNRTTKETFPAFKCFKSFF